jgi:hypothetical protein
MQAMPTGLNSSAHYQPDGLVVFPWEGIYIGIGNVSQSHASSFAALCRVRCRFVLLGVFVC